MIDGKTVYVVSDVSAYMKVNGGAPQYADYIEEYVTDPKTTDPKEIYFRRDPDGKYNSLDSFLNEYGISEYTLTNKETGSASVLKKSLNAAEQQIKRAISAIDSGADARKFLVDAEMTIHRAYQTYLTENF